MMTNEYTFTLTYTIPTRTTTGDELIERLYANDWVDDAIIGIGLSKRIALEFMREGNSMEETINSAHRDVMNVLPEAVLIEVSPGVRP